MFPNNKLCGHQPSIKLETEEPSPNRRQNIILIRIGHTYLTRAYLLKGKTAPQCTCCNQLFTVNHILVDSKKCENSQEIFPGNKPHPAIQRCARSLNNSVPKKNTSSTNRTSTKCSKLLHLSSNYTYLCINCVSH